jgi:hypothetical protein
MSSPLESVKWCCLGLEAATKGAGGRGFGVFVDDTPQPALFVLEHRALDPDAPAPAYEGRLSIVSQTGMRFCPWCGKELLKWYKNDLPKLVRKDLIISLR